MTLSARAIAAVVFDIPDYGASLAWLSRPSRSR